MSRKFIFFTLKLFFIFFFLSFVLPKQTLATDYYVATNGSDSNNGSINSPWKTINYSVNNSNVQPGDTIYLRGGIYQLPLLDSSYNYGVIITKDGTLDQKINLFAYKDEKPILDGSDLYQEQDCLKLLSANNWHIKGLEIRNCPNRGILLNGASNNNILELIEIHHVGHKGTSGNGFHLAMESSNNLLLNCDSYFNDNYLGSDPHENADGFGAKSVDAINNIFRGCRAWNNADDGYDFWNGGYSIIEDCWAWKNGYDEYGNPTIGNGNGFKLGQGTKGHFLKYCLSWENKAVGYNENGQTGIITLYNNTGFGNNNHGTNGWKSWIFNLAPHILRNNLEYDGSGVSVVTADDQYNSWNLPVNVSEADFLSLDDILARGPRNPDGSLPESNFLKLVSSSDLIDVGTDVGLPFAGQAPDLGAFEYGGNQPTPTAALCPADFDGNGQVNSQDLIRVLTKYPSVCSGCREDLFSDSKINILDLAALIKDWGECE